MERKLMVQRTGVGPRSSKGGGGGVEGHLPDQAEARQEERITEFTSQCKNRTMNTCFRGLFYIYKYNMYFEHLKKSTAFLINTTQLCTISFRQYRCTSLVST